VNWLYVGRQFEFENVVNRLRAERIRRRRSHPRCWLRDGPRSLGRLGTRGRLSLGRALCILSSRFRLVSRKFRRDFRGGGGADGAQRGRGTGLGGGCAGRCAPGCGPARRRCGWRRGRLFRGGQRFDRHGRRNRNRRRSVRVEYRHRAIRAVRLRRVGSQQHRDLLHDRADLRGNHLLEHVVIDGLQVRQNHRNAHEVAAWRAHRQENADAAIFHAGLVTVLGSLRRERFDRLVHEAVLIGSERALAQPQHVGFAVVQRNGMQPQRRERGAQLPSERLGGDWFACCRRSRC